MRMVIRIATLVRVPLPFERRELARETFAVRLRPIASSRFGLMMNQRGARLVEGLPAAGIELQTEVDVVESNGKVDLVKSADLTKLLVSDHKACASDRTDALRQSRSFEISWIVSPLKAMGMSIAPSNACEHTGMLMSTVGV